jgi:hypothetical protein
VSGGACAVGAADGLMGAAGAWCVGAGCVVGGAGAGVAAVVWASVSGRGDVGVWWVRGVGVCVWSGTLVGAGGWLWRLAAFGAARGGGSLPICQCWKCWRSVLGERYSAMVRGSVAWEWWCARAASLADSQRKLCRACVCGCVVGYGWVA